MIIKRKIVCKAIVIMLISLQFVLYSCNAQRYHHEAVPCPCEKIIGDKNDNC